MQKKIYGWAMSQYLPEKEFNLDNRNTVRTARCTQHFRWQSYWLHFWSGPQISQPTIQPTFGLSISTRGHGWTRLHAITLFTAVKRTSQHQRETQHQAYTEFEWQNKISPPHQKPKAIPKFGHGISENPPRNWIHTISLVRTLHHLEHKHEEECCQKDFSN